MDKIKEAVNYGKATNEIENQYLTDEEWNEIVKAIEEDRDKSLIQEIVERVGVKKNGKTR